MKRVVIESPYAGRGPTWIHRLIDRWQNIRYARACMADSLRRGEAPIASHLLYTQPGILRDSVKNERLMGIWAGFAWGKAADLIVFYTDRGESNGMKLGLTQHTAAGKPIEHRSLGHR